MAHPDPTYDFLAELERKSTAPIGGGYGIGGGNSAFGSSTIFGLGFAPPSVADVPLYLNVVVSSCISWLSRNFPVADLHVIKVTTEGDGPEIRHHPFIELMDRPNKLNTFHSFWQSYVISDVIDGNTFFVKIGSRAGIHSLWWVPPWDVNIIPSPTRDADRPIDHYEIRVGGKMTEYPPDDVIHIKDGIDPINPYRGLAALKSASRSASTIDRSELFSQTLMKNCGAIPIVISPSGSEMIPADSVKLLKASYADRQTEFNNGTPLFPTYGLKVDKLGLTPEEMAIDQIYEWPVSFVCSTIGMSPMVIGLPDTKKTYSNYEESERSAWQNGLIPRQARAAEAFDRQCPELIDPKTQRLKWDYSHVKALQEDWNKKVDGLVKAVGGPIMTKNEARDMLHLDPVDGGDELNEPAPPPGQMALGANGQPKPGKPGLPPPKKPQGQLPPPKKPGEKAIAVGVLTKDVHPGKKPEGHWVTREGRHLFISGPGHDEGKPSPREQADKHRKSKGGSAWRARAMMAKTDKQGKKHREKAKRAIAKGDHATAKRHTDHHAHLSRRLQRLLPHAVGPNKGMGVDGVLALWAYEAKAFEGEDDPAFFPTTTTPSRSDSSGRSPIVSAWPSGTWTAP